ncbi:MAG TPA: NUDIX domain-containing protein [Clostridia bacterium]|nr:NUDIX domain-containing protein [Clostridia bacterium]
MKTVFSGKIVSVRVDRAATSDDRQVVREVVVHPGAVAVLAVDDAGRIALVKQFRYPTGEILWEIPAGKIDKGEDPWVAARRELLEEVGVAARSWERITEFYSSPGIMTERLVVYRAADLSKMQGEVAKDEDERILVRWVPLKECLEAIRLGGIKDAKTLVAVLWEWFRRGGAG